MMSPSLRVAGRRLPSRARSGGRAAVGALLALAGLAPGIAGPPASGRAAAPPPVAAAGLPAPAGRQAPGSAPAPAAAAVVPACGATLARAVDRRALAEGETLEVRATYGYRCGAAARQADVMLVVGLPAASDRALADNLIAGLVDFVLATDFGNGSRMGLVQYGAARPTVLPLAGGSGGRAALLAAIASLRPGPTADMVGLANAIRAATNQLAGLPTGVAEAIVIVDSGASLLGSSESIGGIRSACFEAGGAGALRLLAQVPGSKDRLAGAIGCADEGWVYAAAEADGADLRGPTGLFRAAADDLLRPEGVLTSEYSDQLADPYFSYVPDSARVDGEPREPDTHGPNRFVWTFDTDPPPGGRVISYQVVAREGPGGGLVPLSREARLDLALPNADASAVLAPDLTLCVVGADWPFCAGLGAGRAFLPFAWQRRPR